MDFFKMYGLAPMTLEEESNAPEAVRQTRSDKMSISNDCRTIIDFANQIADYAKRIPEENSAQHAARVTAFTDDLRSAMVKLATTAYSRFQ